MYLTPKEVIIGVTTVLESYWVGDYGVFPDNVATSAISAP